MATILVVDDEAGIRDFLADALSDAGHDLAQAESEAGQGIRAGYGACPAPGRRRHEANSRSERP